MLREMTKWRGGLTLLEVLIALGIFLAGSVGIIALFVTASVMHTDASNRRKASFIAQSLLSEVQGMRLRDVFAKATLVANDSGGDLTVDAVYPDQDYQAASFAVYPVVEVLKPFGGVTLPPSRREGALLIDGGGAGESEWAWYSDVVQPQSLSCALADRDKWWGTAVSGSHVAGARVLSPRSWYYVLDQDAAAAETQIRVRYPRELPDPPGTGYIVVDGEWMQYSSWTDDGSGNGVFGVQPDGPDSDTAPDGRAVGQTALSAHHAGTPVTVAREYPAYPGFYYAVQFYPVNASGLEAQLVVSVGYGTKDRFRVHTFRSLWSPTRF